jgi:UDP-N-acetyl-D-mannosaminuronic acid transferase (WecB/TagA/CpsF family)
MRRLAEDTRIRRLMQALGAAAGAETRVYFTGGATAVLEAGARRPWTSTFEH